MMRLPYTLTAHQRAQLQPEADRYTAIRRALGDTESTELEAYQHAALRANDFALHRLLAYGITDHS
jgi:hypothetical protein